MNSAEVPIYEQIMNQIKAAILSGELEEGGCFAFCAESGEGFELQCYYYAEGV